MCLGVILSAQTGTMNTRPANNTEGKILTMEETILSRELAPEDLRCRWIDNGHLAIYKEGKWQKYDIADGSLEKFVYKCH